MSRPLATATVRGVFWSGGGQAARQLIQVPASIVLARLLFPEDFGLVGMAMVFIAVAQLFSSFGIGAAIVQSRAVSPAVLSSSFWANAGIATTLAVVLATGSRWIGAFYGDDRVAPVVAVLSVSLVIAAMTAVPRAILHKSMDFPSDARAQVLGSLAGAGVAIGAALAGFGVWSLVLQSVVGNLVTLTFTMYRASWWPGLTFSWTGLRPLASFSGGVLGSNLLSYATRNADNLLIGKFLGSAPLGYYSLAYRLMLYPLSQVSNVITKVLFPALSTLQGDLARFRSGYLLAIGGISTITFPMMLGLLAVEHDFILVVFGDRWLPMETVLKAFCLVGLMQSIGTTVGTIFLSTGETRKMFLLSLFSTPAFIAAFVIGLRWGIEGVAIAYGLVSAALLYVSLTVAFRIIDLSLSAFHRALAGPTAAAVAMYLVVTAAVTALGDRVGTASARLAIAVVTGIAAYSLATLLFNRRQFSRLTSRVLAAARSGG